LIFSQALGVGYGTIETLLSGEATTRVILGVLLVKSTIWAISLRSGTSGGVLAPLLMMGSALGGLLAFFLPDEGPGFWPLIGMAAILGGTMRAPLTGIVFTIELTHDTNILLPLLIGTIVADAFTVLLLRRSILTEKVSRRGYHLSREYSTDPLEILFVRDVMRTNVAAVPADVDPRALAERLRSPDTDRGQRLYPVVDADRRVTGVITRSDLRRLLQETATDVPPHLADLIKTSPVVAYSDEPLRVAVYRMAESGLTRFPVVERNGSGALLGMLSLNDLLRARSMNLESERRRERVLRLRVPFSRDSAPLRPSDPADVTPARGA
ncbi:MAG: chloride channel protein, partial [Dehalococcoidia bacterium]